MKYDALRLYTGRGIVHKPQDGRIRYKGGRWRRSKFLIEQ